MFLWHFVKIYSYCVPGLIYSRVLANVLFLCWFVPELLIVSVAS